MEIVYCPIRIVRSPFSEPSGTPVLDIEPCNPAVDHRERCRVGWVKRMLDGSQTGFEIGNSAGAVDSNPKKWRG